MTDQGYGVIPADTAAAAVPKSFIRVDAEAIFAAALQARPNKLVTGAPKFSTTPAGFVHDKDGASALDGVD
jgi:hypothetical protein